MQNNIAIIRDCNARLEELRAKAATFVDSKANLNARKEQIKKLAREHRDDGSLANEELEAKIAEVEALNTQIAELVEQENEILEEIKSEEQKLADAQSEAEADEEQRTQNKRIIEERTNNMENQKIDVRTAFAKHILFQSTNGKRADAKLTEMEARALGVATTTTSETFVAASSSVDGINNGGVFIPNEIVLDILREEELESPIYRDIVTTAINGKVKFPYRVSKTGAKTKAELSPNENENVEWRILSGATGNYTDSIVITFEEEAMALPEFTDYLISLIGESMRELLVNDYIYGTGTDDHVFGLTHQAIDASYTSTTDYRDAIEAAISKLPVKKRAGAKVYVASNIFDKITFAKNKNGDYILPVLNGGGLTRLSTFPVEVDTNLAEGDFVVGNVSKWYKANINKTLELGLDVSNQKRTKTYTTHMMVTAAPVPQSIVYGKVSG